MLTPTHTHSSEGSQDTPFLGEPRIDIRLILWKGRYGCITSHHSAITCKFINNIWNNYRSVPDQKKKEENLQNYRFVVLLEKYNSCTKEQISVADFRNGEEKTKHHVWQPFDKKKLFNFHRVYQETLFGIISSKWTPTPAWERWFI